MSNRKNLLNALIEGQELTANQIGYRYNLANPHAAISALNQQGYPIYLNNRTNNRGDSFKKYRLGTARRSVIAEGLRATG